MQNAASIARAKIVDWPEALVGPLGPSRRLVRPDAAPAVQCTRLVWRLQHHLVIKVEEVPCSLLKGPGGTLFK